ncbi:hypothetical protein SNOG_03852 [Parastagonospora nodorum SN15]|uniref:Uncharacterized protein n=1 Tax=Phaeosphaeria nodorum (strain SN15 / ATCC MYA-4574 / FGSC 10173) TaxID=321614 RepID=Q0UWL2_PHANO|nr:hypothetical protein SNOG_03852 [Parastagonospora nodorum SN15]EAT89057.1 hypothetical protein SNOG_03852 [Parastagonospora nodorum SN15]
MGNNNFFDFSGPLGIGTWDEAMLLSPNSWPSNPSDLSTHGPQHQLDAISQPVHQPPVSHQSPGKGTRRRACSIPERGHQQAEAASTSPFSAENAPNGTIDEDFLLNTFLQMLMPPILATTEIGPKWATTRAFFNAMAAESLVVRSAIMAFTAMQMQRSGLGGDAMKTDWRPLYDSAARNLSSALASKRKEEGKDGMKIPLKFFLASLFLLTYTDLLTETLPRAHANLREAYTLIQNVDKTSFSIPERRIISWLRLLDARAISTAGGEGLFLADTDETLFDATPAADVNAEPETLDTEIEEILFDVLYHPGIVFYQKKSIFARNLVAALTRSFRTYLGQLLRVILTSSTASPMFKYPKTKDEIDAIVKIKKGGAHLMAQTDESLPVNLLWPLLMWGAEEDDVEERKWIVKAIRGLESIATNAKPTADLLEEVQRRQDEGQRRVDVRSVSQEYFASHHFAIV